MYGTETFSSSVPSFTMFENDVKMYGTETRVRESKRRVTFENDVKMYGTETALFFCIAQCRLRMM